MYMTEWESPLRVGIAAIVHRCIFALCPSWFEVSSHHSQRNKPSSTILLTFHRFWEVVTLEKFISRSVDGWIQWPQVTVFLFCIGVNFLNTCSDNLNSFVSKRTLREETVCSWLNYNDWFPKENSLGQVWFDTFYNRDTLSELGGESVWPSKPNRTLWKRRFSLTTQLNKNKIWGV